MFSFFKRKKIQQLILSGRKPDMYSHLIPGIDDGKPKRLKTLFALIKELQH